MYLVNTYTGETARQKAIAKSPAEAGMNLTEQLICEIAKLEVWGSEFSESDPAWPGEDFCEWHAVDADGNVIAKRRTRGY